MIQAITFDFWDTLVVDDSDEPKRAAMGLPAKPQARLQLLLDEIASHSPEIEPDQVARAFEHANQRFRHSWDNDYSTPTVTSRLLEVYDFLNISATPGLADVVREIEEMEVRIPPDFVPGVHGVIAELAQSYKLAIISDTIHTTGRGIRQLLESRDLLRHFHTFVFSDESGASKPAPAVFEKAASNLGVPLTEIVHVGDRESNDVEGPLAMGMKAILFTGVVDRGSANSRAIAVCKDLLELPAIIRNLDKEDP